MIRNSNALFGVIKFHETIGLECDGNDLFFNDVVNNDFADSHRGGGCPSDEQVIFGEQVRLWNVDSWWRGVNGIEDR